MARKRVTDRTVPITLRLDPDNARVIGHLSRLSGESAQAVIRVVLAMGMIKIGAMLAGAPGRKKTRR